jgi:hypothetical protein
MVFDIGGPWTSASQGSPSKLNKTTVISGPGTDLAALPKLEHVIIKCTVTGGGLTADHVYQASTDGTSWIDMSNMVAHAHSDIASGGNLADIMSANSLFMDTMADFAFDTKKADYTETVTGTAAITDDIDGTTFEPSVKFSTGATSGSAATIRKGGMKLDFSKRSFFQTKLRIGTAADLVYHGGTNVDLVTDTDSNTVKYGAEVCTVTNNNWQIRSASGADKSLTDTGIAMTTNRVAIRLEHRPTETTPRVDMYVDAAAVVQKTSHIPISGTSDFLKLFRHSFKNNTAADKTLFIYGSRIAYYVSDNWV